MGDEESTFRILELSFAVMQRYITRRFQDKSTLRRCTSQEKGKSIFSCQRALTPLGNHLETVQDKTFHPGHGSDIRIVKNPGRL
jgi:hypothetical protein